jgi:catechol 2,3-dioxygenase-like lactoylglutathione lyase family enzyme
MVKRLATVALMQMASPAFAQDVLPWQETIVSVREFEPSTRLFVKAGNWRIVSTGRVRRSELEYWKLPSKSDASYQLLCAPDVSTGCIRFVRVKGVAQRPIRRAVRPWDTGGIYSIMVRSNDVERLFQQALDMGWWAEAQPIRFTFGASDLRNVVLTGPDGMNVAVYERVSPAFTAFPVGRISQAFNSMRMVPDKVAARAFYEKQLGFSVLFDSGHEAPDPTPSNLSIPLNYTPTIRRDAAALQPVPGETGRVEVMQINGFTGFDMSEHAVMPNLGVISVRYPVRGLGAYRARLERNGVGIAYAADNVKIGGLGVANLFAVRDPDGNITEFFEIRGKGK